MITRAILEDQFRAHCAQSLLDLDVFSDGPVNATVAIVGEGPGETEVRKGLPFVGGSGNLLWNCLRKYGLHRANCYVTNVVKRQISLSRISEIRHVVHGDELDKWKGLVNWELSQLPNVHIIFVLGNYALEALTSQSGVMNWRGSVIDRELPNGRMGKVVITINPAYALRELKFEPVFGMDCKKLDLVNRNVFKKHEINRIINPTMKEAMLFIKDLKKSDKPVSFDIEAINQETVCYGLSNNAHKAICINLRDERTNRFTTKEEADILYALQDLCDSHRIIAQNGNFDAYWTRLHDWLCVKVWFDTLLAHHTLYPQLGHSLAFLVAQYTTHPFYKDEGKAWREGGDLNQFWRYNCSDAALTFACYERLEKQLVKEGLDKFFFNHVMRAQPHLVSATVHGVAVDLPMRTKIIEQCSEDVKKLEAEFHRLVQELTEESDYYPNPLSWQQLQVLFFEKLKLKGKGTSTNETNRQYMMKDIGTSPLAKEMLGALNRVKEEEKFFGTYAESKVSEDGRFRCEYKQYGVTKAPGRLSSAALLSGDGGNMQNQPVRARGMYIADRDCVFCYFDLAQAEAQVVSFRADIPKWKEQFERARKDGLYDCHRALASEMFRVPYDKVPTVDWDEDGKPTIRYVSKRCRHGLNYRMEKWKLAEVTQLPYHQAARSFTLYHVVTPELRRWWKEEERLFRRDKQVYNALNRRFRVVQRIDDDVLESIIAFYPQSTIGDKIVQAWYMCEEDDEWPMDARIAIDVHDNLVAIAAPKVAKTCMKIMKKHAEAPIMVQDVYKKRPPEPLIIPAELKMSVPTSWDEKTQRFVPDKKGLHRWSNMEKVKL